MITLRERIDFLLADGRHATSAEIARDLSVRGQLVRTALGRMHTDHRIVERGGLYFTTEETRQALADRVLRRGPKPRPTSSLVERHLTHLTRRGLRPSTVDRRRKALSRLETWLTSRECDVLDATPELLDEFIGFARGPSARRSWTRDVSGFYRWLVEYEEALASNPARKLVLPRDVRGLPRPISEERLERAVAEAKEPARAWFVLAAWCGLRCMEIAPLHDRDVDLEHLTLTVRDGKGGRPRVLPMPAIVVEALEPQLGRGYLFQRVDPPPGPISAGDLQHRANDTLHELGLEETMHQLRHRYATQVYEASGFDLIATQRLLGHRSIASTTVYAQARPTAELHKVVAQLPGGFRAKVAHAKKNGSVKRAADA